VPLAPHLVRRGAIYHFRRKLPKALAACQNRQHLIVSLRTANPLWARSVAVQLDALMDDLLVAPKPNFLTSAQMDRMLRAAVEAQLEKLERLAAAEKTDPVFDAQKAARVSKQVGWAFSLLAAGGEKAPVAPSDLEAMQADGFTDEDIDFVDDHIARLVRQGIVPTNRARLAPLLASQGAEPTAMNLALAQQVYLRAMSIAAFASVNSYKGEFAEANHFIDNLRRARVDAAFGAASAASPPPASMPEPPPDHTQTRAGGVTASSPTHVPDPEIDDRITIIGGKLAAKRKIEERWDRKTQIQAERLFELLAKFLKEEHGIERLSQLRQSHLDKFVQFLSYEIYKHYGRSRKDRLRSIAELRKIARDKDANARALAREKGLKECDKLLGIEVPTLNRHLTALNQLIVMAPALGVALTTGLNVSSLRGKKSKNKRGRNARPTMAVNQSKLLFSTAPFIGCLSWDRPYDEGEEIYDRSLYWVPLLIHYLGLRREEACGLLPEDLITDNGPNPYLHVAGNSLRRIKNIQSQRNLPLHSEHIRLGLVEYRNKIQSLGHTLMFPDLLSPTTKSPLGDRHYDELNPLLIRHNIKKKGLASHALRRGFGNNLKQKLVTEEQRGDLLGHGGNSEAAERYCEAYEVELLSQTVEKSPNVTAHLKPHPIRLLPWVERKEVAPFSREPRIKPA